MALETQWTKRAAKSFDEIIEFIIKRWSEDSAKKFVKKSDKLVKQIEKNPEMCQKIEDTEVRRGVITKQTSIYYIIKGNFIRLITFWDNRKDPKKLKL